MNEKKSSELCKRCVSRALVSPEVTYVRDAHTFFAHPVSILGKKIFVYKTIRKFDGPYHGNIIISVFLNAKYAARSGIHVPI